MGTDRPGKLELFLVGLITLVGAYLRFQRISEIGLSHYDAGVYAQSALWPWTGQFHFAQGYFSPPLYPILVGLANFALGGPTDWAGPLVSAIFGTAIIPLGWWMGRTWFTPIAGVVAAFFLSFDGMQIVFSRCGITDSTFTFLFILSLILCRSAIERAGWWRVLAAGIVVGLAWNTKYNGFLPLVLSAPWILHPSWKERIPRLLLIALIAGLFYLPWAAWFHVQHGYGSLIEHQRGYFRGVAGVWGGLHEFAGNFRHVYSHEIFCTASLFAVGACLLVKEWRPSLLLLAGAMMVWMFKSPQLVLVVCFLLTGIAIRRLSSLAERTAFITALVILFLLPAAYSPYFRLWLPAEALLMIFASAGLANTFTWGSQHSGPHGSVMIWKHLSLGIPLVLLVAINFTFDGENLKVKYDRVCRPTVGYRNVAQGVIRDTPPDTRFLTLCRWPMNYYLALAGRDVAPLSGEPISVVSFRVNDLLIVDQSILDTPSFQDTFEDAKRIASNTSILKVDPDLVTWSDDFSPRYAYLRPDLENANNLFVLEFKPRK